MQIADIMVIALMLLLNAVFAAYELALASVTASRLEELAAQNRAGAKAAVRMKGRMEASLAVVQLGITLVGVIAAAVGGAGAAENVGPWLAARFGMSAAAAEIVGLGIVVLPLSAVTIIAGELVPKTLAIKNADWVCLKFSPAMRWFALSVYPLVLVLEWLTRLIVRLVQQRVDRDASDVSTPGMAGILAEARTLRLSRVISLEQARVIEGAGRLAKSTVQDILVPPDDIKMLYVDGRLTEHLVTVHLEAHTRFPVTSKPGDAQGIVGYVNVKDIFFLAKTHPQNPNLAEIVRPLPAIAPTEKVGEAMRRMMAEHAHLALVRDSAGQVHGMITLEDVLEEVVGDIQDEFDRLPRNLTRSGHQWIVGGGVPLARLREVLNRPELGPGLAPAISLSDWITSQREASPKSGDVFAIDHMRVLIRKVRRGHVMEALVDVVVGETLNSTPPTLPTL